MKFYKIIPALFFQSVLIISSTYGQAWETYFEHEDIEHSPLTIAYPSANGGACLVVNHPFQFLYQVKPPIFSFDDNGNFIGMDSLANTSGWDLIHGDKSGASYWLKDNQLRKLTPNNQIAWSYPSNGDYTAIQFLPNGNICLSHQENSGQVIDLINPNAQIVSSFIGHYQFAAGSDNSLIYTDDDIWSPIRHWSRIDQFGQILWELDLDKGISPIENSYMMMGAFYDGTTLLYNSNNGSIVKLDGFGNVVWEKMLLEFSPNFDPYYFVEGFLVREDESIILSTSNYDFSLHQPFIQFINIDPMSGDSIWITHTYNPSSGLVSPMEEMPDGGILACFHANIPGVNHHRVHLVRTNAVGGTSVQTHEPATIQAKAWPMPAHDQVAIALPPESPGILSWKLVDLTGQVLRSGSSEPANFRVQRNGLPSGIYGCQLLLENGETAVGRLIFD